MADGAEGGVNLFPAFTPQPQNSSDSSDKFSQESMRDTTEDGFEL